MPAQPAREHVVGEITFVFYKLSKIKWLSSNYLRLLEVSKEHPQGAHAARRLALAEHHVEDPAPRLGRAQRRRSPQEHQRNEDDRARTGRTLALEPDGLLDIRPAKPGRLPAEQRVRPLEEQHGGRARADHLVELLDVGRAPVAPQEERAAHDAPERLQEQRLDPVGEPRERQPGRQKSESEIEVIDVTERSADVDHLAGFGGLGDPLRQLGGEGDLAKEAGEHPAEHRAGPLDHRGGVRLLVEIDPHAPRAYHAGGWLRPTRRSSASTKRAGGTAPVRAASDQPTNASWSASSAASAR